MSLEIAISLFGILMAILGAGWKLSKILHDLEKSMSDQSHALDVRLVKLETKLESVKDSLKPITRGASGEHLLNLNIPRNRAPSWSDDENTVNDFSPEEKTNPGIGPNRR